jgi:serine/threonine protein kinase
MINKNKRYLIRSIWLAVFEEAYPRFLMIRPGLKQYPILGPYSNIYIHTLPHDDRAFKELRCVPADRNYIDRVISVSSRLWNSMNISSSHRARGQMYETRLEPMWSSLSHENIVPFLGISTDNGLLPVIEAPYYKNGNISNNHARTTAAIKLRQIMEIAAGISYLHANGVHHGNICAVRSLSGDPTGLDSTMPDLLSRQTL